MGLRKKKLRSVVPNATARRLPRTGHASGSGGVSHGLQLGEREREREVEDDRKTKVEDDVSALGSRSDGYKPSPERIGVFRLMKFNDSLSCL